MIIVKFTLLFFLLAPDWDKNWHIPFFGQKAIRAYERGPGITICDHVVPPAARDSFAPWTQQNFLLNQSSSLSQQ